MEKILPKNWVKTELGSLFNLAYGKGLSIKELITDGEYNVYGANGIIGKYNVYNQKESIVIISCRGAASGAIHKTNPESFVTSNSIVLDAYSDELLLPNYVKYFMTSTDKTEIITGTAQPQITIQLLKNLNFCFPPLAEQQRIVTKLDEIFGHLDTLKTRLEKIPNLLKNCKQAILTQAVTGKLTEEWCVGKELEKWKETTIGNLFKVKTGATPKRGNPTYYENGKIPWLKSGQVQNQLIYQADEFITELAVKETNAKVYPKDTLLVAMYGEGKTRGQVGWMKLEAASNQAIAALVNEEMEITTKQYVYYYCLSQYLEIRKQAEGGNQPNLNLSKIKNWQISLPPKKEQTEIVKRVENLFAKLDSIEKQYQSLKTKIDSLPQAILAKAFKGELVPQLPTDGDAKELLEKIQQLKDSLTVKKKKTRKKKA